MTDSYSDTHPEADDLAAYLDRSLDAEARARLEAHVAWCAECRAELREVSAILRSAEAAPRRRLAWIAPAAAAAAAVILLVALPRGPASDPAPSHRDAPGLVDRTPELAPGPETGVLRWSRVERADRYRVTVFSEDGTVIWRTETPDTSVALPDTAGVVAGGTYLWRVDARVGIDRWVESKLETLSP